LIEEAIALDKRALARLVTLCEDPRPERLAERAQVFAALAAHPARRTGYIVGVTGTPGAGKSTLIGEVAMRLCAAEPAWAAAVVAVDPSSHVSGGALLGDRTRVRFPTTERRLFFRSQASERALGGLAPATFGVCRLLVQLFDVVFVETVGIGQSEIEVSDLADLTLLVLQPLGGDQVQFLKAGIMEIPDAIVLNKWDEGEAARRSWHSLRASLKMARPDGAAVSIHRTSARTGEGVDALMAEIAAAVRGEAGPPRRPLAAKEARFFAGWIRDEYGRAGERTLARLAPAGAAAWLAGQGGYDAAVAAFVARMSGERT
jgi:LAO/AO transport system kinase